MGFRSRAAGGLGRQVAARTTLPFPARRYLRASGIWTLVYAFTLFPRRNHLSICPDRAGINRSFSLPSTPRWACLAGALRLRAVLIRLCFRCSAFPSPALPTASTGRPNIIAITARILRSWSANGRFPFSGGLGRRASTTLRAPRQDRVRQSSSFPPANPVRANPWSPESSSERTSGPSRPRLGSPSDRQPISARVVSLG